MTAIPAAHTPGPWVEMRVERHHDYVILQRLDDNTASGLVLAMISNDGIAQRTCEANARLIAAAPELLEALLAHEAALQHLESFELDMNPDRHKEISDELFAQAEALTAAAISKARGYTPTREA